MPPLCTKANCPAAHADCASLATNSADVNYTADSIPDEVVEFVAMPQAAVVAWPMAASYHSSSGFVG